MCHSPTAIALGSSAIVKVSGRNCFRTLYGSLGQIRLGLPKGSAEGSTKVPPCFHCGSSKGAARIHQGPSGFVVSVVLWNKSVVRSYKVPWKVHQGFTKVPPRLRKFCDLSRLLGQIRFGVPKGSVEGSLITSLNWSPSSGKMTRLSSWILCSRSRNRLPRGSLECSPKRRFFWANGCCFRKGSVEGSANCALRLSPSLLVGSKFLKVLTCSYKSSPHKTKYHVVAVGVFFGLIFFHYKFGNWKPFESATRSLLNTAEGTTLVFGCREWTCQSGALLVASKGR